MVVHEIYAAPCGSVLAEQKLPGSAAWMSLAKVPKASQMCAQSLMALPCTLTRAADPMAVRQRLPCLQRELCQQP